MCYPKRDREIVRNHKIEIQEETITTSIYIPNKSSKWRDETTRDAAFQHTIVTTGRAPGRKYGKDTQDSSPTKSKPSLLTPWKLHQETVLERTMHYPGLTICYTIKQVS